MDGIAAYMAVMPIIAHANVSRQASDSNSLKPIHPAEWLLFDAILLQNIPCPLTEMRGADELPLGSLDVILLQVVELSIK